MKSFYFFLFVLLFNGNFQAQSLYFPPLTGDTWETIDPLTLGWCQENIDEFYTYLENTHSKAFIYLKEGKIVLEKYFGTFTKDSLHIWNSAGKTLTGFAIGIAQEEGYLTINDTTSQYLGQGWTSLTPQQEEKITILHQLTMTSGLNHTGDYYCTDPACLVYIAEPGTRWMYHNGPYTLLDDVIENASGMNLNTFVQQKIRSKIGMNGFFFQAGYNNINLSTARSMARFGLLMLNQGSWGSTVVLGDQNYFNSMINSSQNLNPSYGYLTWLNGKGSYMIPSPYIQLTVNENALPNAPLDIFAAIGKDGQIINVSPSEKSVLIRMGDDDGTSLVSNQYNDTIWQKMKLLSCNSGLSENQDANPQIYPNPAKNQLTLEGFKNAANLEIKSIAGETICRATFSKQIDISYLSEGLYLISIATDESKYIFKFYKE